MIERDDGGIVSLVICDHAASAVYTRLQSCMSIKSMEKKCDKTIVCTNDNTIYVIARKLSLDDIEKFVVAHDEPVFILVNKRDVDELHRVHLTRGETKNINISAPEDRNLSSFTWLRVDLPSLYLCKNRDIIVDPWTCRCIVRSWGQISILQPHGSWEVLYTSSLKMDPRGITVSI